MPEKLLTRAEAWGVIAAKLLNDGRVETGLCREVLKLWDFNDRVISEATMDAMEAQVKAHQDGKPGVDCTGRVTWNLDRAFAYPMGTHHEERAMAALWMAEEALEEGRSSAAVSPVSQ